MSANTDQPSYALVGNPVQRTPCILVLDASGSMLTTPTSSTTPRIAELNKGLKHLETELRADATASTRVQIAIVSVGGPLNDALLMLDWTDAKDFRAFELKADNQTPLGKGLTLALDRIEQQKAAYKQHGISYTRPWMMVITDGQPTDDKADWEAAVRACRTAESARKCVIYPIGVEGTDVTKLQAISTTPVMTLNQLKFVELFQWLSTSLEAASRSAPGADSVQLPSTNPWVTVKT